MPKIAINIVVASENVSQCVCSVVEIFSLEDTSFNNKSNSVVMLGLPVEMPNEVMFLRNFLANSSSFSQEFEHFIEPFLNQILSYTILVEVVHPLICTFGIGSLSSQRQQCKKSAVISFSCDVSRSAFISLYNNMQVPSFSEIAPCLILAVDHLELSVDAVNCVGVRSSMLSDVAAANTNKDTAVFWKTGSPLRCVSGDHLATNSPVKLMNSLESTVGLTVDAPPSTPLNSKSLEHANSSSARKQSSPSKADPSLPRQLPSCVVCLRRIATVGRTIPGAGDLKICRSYIYDNNEAVAYTGGQDTLSADSLRFSPKSRSQSISHSRSHSPHAMLTSPSMLRSSKHNSEGDLQQQQQDQERDTVSECVRCVVCHVYSVVSDAKFSSKSNTLLLGSLATDNSCSSSSDCKTASASLSSSTELNRGPLLNGFCMDCGLEEGIWLCMLCSYTGCGRYKAQHAQQHYQRHNHTLSMELASGRIWDYHSDSFVHVDDSTAIEHISASASNNGSHRPLDLNSDGTLSSDVSFLVGNDGISGVVGSNSAADRDFQKKYSLAVSRSSAESEAQQLDPATVSKMNGLVGDYEHLLRSQLLDQQLHYEKLLARETVRALELTYHGNSSSSNQTGSSGNSKVGRQKTCSSSLASKSDTAHVSGTEFKSGSDLGAETAADDDLLHFDAEQIETMKMDISAVEAQYRAVLEKIKAVEEESRAYRKQNDALIKNQKALREKESELLLREESCRQRCASQVADMEQQIRDLTFYTKARKEVQVSPLKHELMEGTVVTSSVNTSEPDNSSHNKQKGTGSSAKGGKGYRQYKK